MTGLNETASISTPEIRTRIVLLGASNLALAWPRIMDQLQSRFAAPLDIYTANGMGRSYVCDRSGFALRQLPGILRSGIWDALPVAGPQKTQSVAILTDFGNDLLYGRKPTEIVAAAEECITRLRRWDENCQVVMTRPPVDSVNTLGWLRFTFSRFVLFPLSKLTLAGVKTQTLDLDQGLQEVATRLNIPVYQPHADWYGLDPIHVRRKHRSTAFGEMMNLWPVPKQALSCSENRSRPTAAIRWVFGKQRETTQPSITSTNTNVFAY